MIYIEEATTIKTPGETALFIAYPPISSKEQKALVFNYPGSYFFDKESVWEVPVTYLARLVDEYCTSDDISIKLSKDVNAQKIPQVFDIGPYKLQPFDYQVEGIQYGLNNERFLLLDEPGLGKTLQLIHIAEELHKQGKVEKCLVVCGLNSLKENWRKEILKHSDLSCHILGEKVSSRGKRSIGSIAERALQLKSNINAFFVITNIESLRDERIIKELRNPKSLNKFDCIFVDEIHACKDPESQQGRNLLKLAGIKHCIGATGTLLMNSPLDAYVPLKFIGAERSNYTQYKYYYCTFGGQKGNIIVGLQNTQILKDIISKHSLRRTKDLLNLPPKNVIEEYVEMSSSQDTFYNNIKNGVKDQVDKVRLNTKSLLALVTRLRQATACPSILTSENIRSAKVDRAIDLAHQIVSSGQKVVIFSTFKETVKVIANYLREYNPLICTGDSSDEEISQNIDKFQTDPDSKVFIGTWQKVGTGITLTAANYEIFIDTPWTQAVFTQAQDRCYRIGTTKSVTVYHLITLNTIDERVRDILEDKGAISDYVVDDKIVSDKALNSLLKYLEEL